MAQLFPVCDEFEVFGGLPNAQACPVTRERLRQNHASDRLLVVALFFLGAFVLLAGRLLELSVFRADAKQAGIGAYVPPPARAAVLDRNGQILATNIEVPSLYADPSEVWDVREAVTKLKAVFPDLESAKLTERLTAKGRFAWIKRDVTPDQAERVRRMGLPGLYFAAEQRRAYLQGSLFSHVMGGVDIDNKGTAGIEKALDARITEAGASPLALSLDLSVQHVMREELNRAMVKFKAKGAAGLVMDANTGELLAMASLPDFDPNQPGDPQSDERMNRTTLGVYEMGSTFKILTTAMALDSGKVSLNSGYDASHPIRIGRFAIRDYHSENRWLSVAEIFEHSSNIGSARMAVDIGVDAHKAFLRKLGLFERPRVELTEVGRPLVPAQWHEINTMTIAFGHGMAVSPISLVKAVAPIVNGGTLVEPTLVKHARPIVDQKQVVSATTSRIMRDLMRKVVLKGTGTKANVAGYEIGGKTGTAEKVNGHGYARHALMSSFIAIFPAQAPRYVVLVMVDEPQGTAETMGFATGGWTAAPTAGEIIKRVAPILRVSPVWDNPNTVMAAN